MLAILCLIWFFSLCVSEGVLDDFVDITNELQDSNGMGYTVREYRLMPVQDKKEALEECARNCIKGSYFCHSFVVYAISSQFQNCILLNSLGSGWHKPPFDGNDVLGVYRRRALPTEQELLERFSYETTTEQDADQWSKSISLQYMANSRANDVEFILQICQASLLGTPPMAVSIRDWLTGKELSDCQVNLGSDYRLHIYKAFQSWQLWPAIENTSDLFDIITLMFVDVVFRSVASKLELAASTIYDPLFKTVIIDETELHMLLHSYGSGEYGIIIGDSCEDVACHLQWISTSRSRNQPDPLLVDVFGRAMNRLGHNVKDLYSTHILGHRGNSLERAVQVINVMFSWPSISPHVTGLDVLYRDVVTAVLYKVLNFHMDSGRLHQTLKGAKMSDVDIYLVE